MALRQVILGNKLPSAKDMTDAIPGTWDAVWAEEEGKDGFIGWEWNEGDSPESAKADIAPLITLARNEVLEKIRPVHVEHDWNVTMDDGAGGPFARKHDVQIDAYGYWVSSYMSLDVVQMRKVYLVRSKRPKIDAQKYEVGPMHRARFEQMARAARRRI